MQAMAGAEYDDDVKFSAWMADNGAAVQQRLTALETVAVSTRVQSMLDGLDATTRDAVMAKLQSGKPN